MSSSISISKFPLSRPQIQPSIVNRLLKRGRWLIWFFSGMVLFFIFGIALVLICVDGNTILRYKRDMLEYKLDRLRETNRPPHLIIMSGSNGLYSVNSKVLSEEIKMPVTNMAVHWGIALYTAERISEWVKPGDIVLMPLEYTFYTEVGQSMSWEEACYKLAHDRASIHSLKEWGWVLMGCKPKMLLGGIGLKTLSKLGFQYPQYDMKRVLTSEGDILENRLPLEKFLSQENVNLSTQMHETDIRTHYVRLEEKIQAIKAAGAKVLLTFPVHFKTPPNMPLVSPQWLAKIKRWAAEQGIEVISSPDQHQFPSNCFFDNYYHLHQGCTGENSKRYAHALKEYLEK